MEQLYLIYNRVIKKIPSILYDISMIPLAWYLSYWLRFNMHPYPGILNSSHSYIALSFLVVVQTSCYYYFKTYRGLWRFFSLNDVLRILKATITAVVLVIPVLYLSSVLQHLPRAIFPLYALIIASLLCAGRLTLRLHSDKQAKSDQATNEIKRVLIIGAGQAGEGLVRDLQRSNDYKPIGFVDDNVHKKGLEIHGVKVLGSIRHIQRCVQNHAVDLIFIAIPSARSASMRRIVRLCESTHVPFRTLPSLAALASGRVEVNALRSVKIDDLLGRDPVCLNWDKIAQDLSGRRVLVTGGGGSIGSELCRQVLSLNPQSLTIVDSSEFHLFEIEQELKAAYPQASIAVALMSVTDKVAVEHVFKQAQPEVVFHAAAYKHVPMLQEQVRVAVLNNVIGTQIVAKASVTVAVEKFILISTDKAVNPTNIMGTTKRVAEIYCQNLNERVATQFITVRFGNVLGSKGSVIPLFQKQLKAGGPLTVTHPDMQRYFMTIPEASQLILQAMANGHGGEIFVLDMGEPIKISYLAEQMIRLAGKEPMKDIAIEYTGLRPGEKLYEELFHESEQLLATGHEKLFKATFREIDWNDLTQTIRMLHTACAEYHSDELIILLKSLVPELQLKETLFVSG